MDDTTHDEQNARIARMLGWRVGTRSTPGYSDIYILVRPDGKPGFAHYHSEAEAWQHAPDFRGDQDESTAAIIAVDAEIQVVLRINQYEHKAECMLVRQGLDLPDEIRIPAFAYGANETDFSGAAANALEALLVARAKETGRE